MPRKTDRLYVTHTEHSGVHGQHTAGSGGHVAKATASKYQPLPFHSCAISLQPWTTPMCDPDGIVYELTNIMPWIAKHGSSPATGKPLKASQLLKLYFQRNENTGQWQDPVSFKTFNDSTHIVAVGTSGNVYAFDTVQQLNVKPKYWADLLTGEEFARKDLINLQDPNNVSGRNVADLHHLKAGLSLDGDAGADEVNVNATGSAGALLQQLKEKKEAQEKEKTDASNAAQERLRLAAEAAKAAKDGTSRSAEAPAPNIASTSKSTLPAKNAGIISTGRTAASFTSTGLTPRTQSERETLNDEETMYNEMRKIVKGKSPAKGYVKLVTNFGPLNLELHCDKAPKTCYNFLSLCQQGKYTDTIFHRLIPGFCIQGGDPTGTGTGGESIWGKPFGDELDEKGAYRHTSRGVLSMANRGPGTNTSQFFITFAPKPHLDKKHTVFGNVMDLPSTTLDALERIPTDAATDKPLRTVRILEVQVFGDPFAEYAERQAKKLRWADADEVKKREEKREKREKDRTTWLGTRLGESDDALSGVDDRAASSRNGVGKYLNAATTTKNSQSSTVSVPPPTKKRKQEGNGGGFGDFSNW